MEVMSLLTFAPLSTAADKMSPGSPMTIWRPLTMTGTRSSQSSGSVKMLTRRCSTPALCGRQCVARSVCHKCILLSKLPINIFLHVQVCISVPNESPDYKCECVQGYVQDPQVRACHQNLQILNAFNDHLVRTPTSARQGRVTRPYCSHTSLTSASCPWTGPA